MSDIALFFVIGLFAATFIYELCATTDLDEPTGPCAMCGETLPLCLDALDAIGEPCCHRCGRLMHDVDSGAQICRHDTATWRRK